MVRKIVNVTVLGISMIWCAATSSLYGQVGGDFLGETSVYGVPEGMTYEEYRDANRRVTIGTMLASFPVPGMMHFYAGEGTTGWWLVGVSAVGLGSLIGGIATVGGDEYPDSDYETVDIGEKRYEKIPVEEEGGVIKYQLREMYKELEPAGLGLIVAGSALLVGEVLYDWIHGIKVIEEKRDRVRYKYGQKIKLGLSPKLDLNKRGVGVELALEF